MWPCLLCILPKCYTTPLLALSCKQSFCRDAMALYLLVAFLEWIFHFSVTSDVVHAVYDYEWYRMKPIFKTATSHIIRGAEKSIRYHAWALFQMNLETFVAVCAKDFPFLFIYREHFVLQLQSISDISNTILLTLMVVRAIEAYLMKVETPYQKHCPRILTNNVFFFYTHLQIFFEDPNPNNAIYFSRIGIEFLSLLKCFRKALLLD